MIDPHTCAGHAWGRARAAGLAYVLVAGRAHACMQRQRQRPPPTERSPSSAPHWFLERQPAGVPDCRSMHVTHIDRSMHLVLVVGAASYVYIFSSRLPSNRSSNPSSM